MNNKKSTNTHIPQTHAHKQNTNATKETKTNLDNVKFHQSVVANAKLPMPGFVDKPFIPRPAPKALHGDPGVLSDYNNRFSGAIPWSSLVILLIQAAPTSPSQNLSAYLRDPALSVSGMMKPI